MCMDETGHISNKLVILQWGNEGGEGEGEGKVGNICACTCVKLCAIFPSSVTI